MVEVFVYVHISDRFLDGATVHSVTRPRKDCGERTFSEAPALQVSDLGQCVVGLRSALRSDRLLSSKRLGRAGRCVAQGHGMLLRRSRTTREGAFKEFLLTVVFQRVMTLLFSRV